MYRKSVIGLLLALCSAGSASAQFYTGGEDPFGRWSTFSTQHYRMVYPVGMDSLAFRYAGMLEAWQPLTGVSAGMPAGSFQWGRTPVILHTRRPYSNGSVTWAPRRVEFYTCPDPYNSLPQPWEEQLVVHEQRHHAQMQFPYRKGLSWLNYLVGEMGTGALSGLFPNQALLEGDAVVAETALSRSGRGRSADFLNYFHVAYDKGDWRDWYQWVYGSFKKVSPDHYTTGYMTVAGMRYFYDTPRFTADYFDHVVRHPWPVASLQRHIRRISGKKFKETYRSIQEGFQALWTDEAAARAPFMPQEQLSRTPSFATDYSGLTALDGQLYALKQGKSTVCRLVLLAADGSERDLGAFSGTTSVLFADPVRHRLYWSETISDPRWGEAGESRIRFLDLTTRRKQDLTREGRLFNPVPSPDGQQLLAVEYPESGGSRLQVLSADDGAVLASYPAPEGVQLTESAFLDGTVYALGIAAEGFGIWRREADGWTCVSAPSPVSMRQLKAGGGALLLVSDLNGVNEWYSFQPSSGRILRLTGSRYGGSDYCRVDSTLFYTAQTLEGRMIFRTPLSALQEQPADFSAVHSYPVAEELSRQEAALLAGAPAAEDYSRTAVKPYYKPLHLIKFHSWAPLWVNYDALSSMSGDFSYNTAAPGLTGFFQNDLGTAYGSLGYAAHPDPDTTTPWRHALHAQFTYTGLYPVLEARLDFNDRGSLLYYFYDVWQGDSREPATTARVSDQPGVSASLSAWIPWRFNKGGWLRGITPRLSWGLSNAQFHTGTIRVNAVGSFYGLPGILRYQDFEPGKTVWMHSITASVRGYAMLGRASSQTYTRLGVGAEAGFALRPGLTGIFSPTAYTYFYGYLPGITPVQGLRATMISQWMLGQAALGESHVNFTPRGFPAAVAREIATQTTSQTCLTLDYAIPIYVGDLSFLSPVAYIRNFLAIPHFDFSFFGGTSLWSLGADLSVELGNLAWFPFDGSIGVELDYLGGAAYPAFQEASLVERPFYAGLIFSLDI